MGVNAPKLELRAEAARLQAVFLEAGAHPVETDILQPAETLLDLYGEDIRARAYVTADPLRGEQMLRPDFTVPVVQMHMQGGADPARYTYAGEVFRKQEASAERAAEYLQVGLEIFGGSDPARADAEVFDLVQRALSDLNLRAATGDIGILRAAVEGLETTRGRRDALLRHIWRPRRFRALLERFAGITPPDPSRLSLLEGDIDGLLSQAGPQIGLRDAEEIRARLLALREEARTPPLSGEQTGVLEDLAAVRETAPNALSHMRDMAVDLPRITPALDLMERRLEALAARGVSVDRLEFEASYGRTTMEYYDGFVFGFYAAERPDLPPVATGGRYDALTRVLGQGRAIPAVGGVIRPELTLAQREAGA